MMSPSRSAERLVVGLGLCTFQVNAAYVVILRFHSDFIYEKIKIYFMFIKSLTFLRGI